MSKRAKRPIPVFDHPLIETHCHLDYLEQAPLDEILRRCQEVGVERVVTIAVDPTNLDRVRELAGSADWIHCTQGIHPHEASHYAPEVGNRIAQALNDDNVVAVGEIGLDYYYDNAPREVQREAFAAQLAIAAEQDRPIVVHTRDAEDDTRAILSEFAPQLHRKGVIHSFTSSVELAESLLELGFHLGFNGIITFNRADNVRQVLEATPVERILVETDAPFLTPVPYRGKENAPFYLPFVAEKVAEVKQVPIDELLPQLRENSLDVFWPE